MSKKYTVTFLPQKIKIEVDEGTTILTAQQMAGLEPDAPCGGKGDCGKCRVNIVKGPQTGVVLACQTPVKSDISVDTMSQAKIQKILTDGFSREVEVLPGVGRSAGDKRPFYLMAFDIGTTTIVGYLLDGTTGREMAVASMMNPQHQFGADVIARANYVLEHDGEEMKKVVRKALNTLIGQACTQVGVNREDILQVSVVGNTCMHHLFMGISPQSLVLAPYVPAMKEGQILKASDCDIKVAEDGILIVLPNIAGFVGADTVGCMLCVAFDQLEKLTLMIDIGTNGELVMGNKDRMITTSTAAGPAFEGAKIECGMRGSKGAISHVTVENGELKMEIVEDAKSVGICGSGLIDTVAFMIRNGFVDDSGHICDPEDLEGEFALSQAWRLQDINGSRAFLLIPAEETENGTPIYLSQKDIREVQLAKGAIAAGIQLMAKKLGIQENDIEQVYLAGAFGNYMDADNACEIGLIPYELKERIVPIGNAAGEGSKLAVVNRSQFEYACAMSEKTDFIELASEADFQDTFVDELEFARAVER